VKIQVEQKREILSVFVCACVRVCVCVCVTIRINVFEISSDHFKSFTSCHFRWHNVLHFNSIYHVFQSDCKAQRPPT